MCLNDTSWSDELHIGTTVFVYRRTATVYYFQSNLTIFQVSDLSPPIETNFTVIDIASGLLAVINNTQCPSSLARYSANLLPTSDSATAAIIAQSHTRSVFTLVFQYFNANVAGGDEMVWTLKEPRQGLPQDMYSTASISRPVWQSVASKRSLWLYLGLEGALLLVCFAAILLSMRNSEKRSRRTRYVPKSFQNCRAII